MNSQQHLFDLPADIHYLNCAYMSPQLKAVTSAGIDAIRIKTNPAQIKAEDFFSLAEEVRKKFARLVNAAPEQIALIPSVSYGIQSAINNIPTNKGTQAITIADTYPSDYYPLREWCRKNGKTLQLIQTPASLSNRGRARNEMILEAINKETSVVVITSIHWTDGTVFDLEAIGKRCREVDAVFIVDGTQSVGAMPLDLSTCAIDALICTCYKWMLGPYSLGLAYYSERFNDGVPLEQAWINKPNATQFTALTEYTDNYRPGAARYNMGEYGNFILLPMLDKALEQVLAWNLHEFQQYCGLLIEPLLQSLKALNCWVDEVPYRTNHLFGIVLPPKINQAALLQELQRNKIYVSVRGDAIRVSPHVYNVPADIEALIQALKTFS